MAVPCPQFLLHDRRVCEPQSTVHLETGEEELWLVLLMWLCAKTRESVGDDMWNVGAKRGITCAVDFSATAEVRDARS